ncbi:MAG: 16S rRNA (cytidine(1402)-2'-O)-methyltransferase [Candidatus Bipolaricaulis sibiricus]|uniref:Ribosomal RNA small subunit methyltransferase I n=1 Tax=Bipolaricaulis sibiricus TaxID=2501609 RepID=A0A410FSJ4_BIPS1|nr:MAG: 16S rRNA (cytidine(1402)-2'-O)-methyltransferase [Candidatus Bipolaricaulis sibiricus]
MAGTLYVCSTPIGNLEDITLRALRVLREVDLIVGEDTRRTRKLLSHYGIHTRFAPSLFQGAEDERTREVIALLRAGKTVALVSDAGTPLLSDPGYPLVRACVGEGIPVVPVPGPSALLAALVASGLPMDRFLFLGHLPRQPGPRGKALEVLDTVDCTVVFYESPHRIAASLRQLAERWGSRPVAVARELTKLHEEFVRGTAAEVERALAARAEVRGELAIVVGPPGDTTHSAPSPEAARTVYAELIAAGLSPREALQETAHRLNLSRRRVYQTLHSKSDGSASAA